MKFLAHRFFFTTFLFFLFSAVFASDHKPFDDELFKPAQVINEDLRKKVNFSFKDIPLSSILLLLSKEGNFNVILPEEYNRSISITLTEQRIIDAVDDIASLTKLKYQFKGNSLIFYKSDLRGMQFASVPLAYSDAQDILQKLNEGIFHQLSISQNPNAIKPYATVDPAKNSVLIFGNEEQVSLIREHIDLLDSPPKVSLYTASFLSLDDMRKVIKMKLSSKNTLNLESINSNTVLLKGQEKELFEGLRLIKTYDLPPEPVIMHVELYTPKSAQQMLFAQANNVLTPGLPRKLNAEIFSNEKLIDPLKYFDLKEYKDTLLNKGQDASVYDLKISAVRDQVEKNMISVRIFEQDLYVDLNNDYVALYFDKELLKSYKTIAAKSADHVLILVFRVTVPAEGAKN